MNFKFLAMALVLILSPSMSYPSETNWVSVADEVGNKLKEGQALYETGDMPGAKGKVTDAYFEIFEGKGMETEVKLRISEKRGYELESMFSEIRKGIDRKTSLAELAGITDTLIKALKDDAGKMDMDAAKTKDKASPIHLFFDSFIIIVREGFEAILIISALIAYLVKTGHGDKKKRIYLGAILAIIASIVTAVIMNAILTVSGPAREGMEGATMLTATAVLFYVSYWLISKAEVGRWQRFIKSKIEASLSGRSLFALSSAAFLAVYREGAETILFYQALHSSAGEGGTAVVMYGFVAGAASLSLIYLAIKYLSIKIPLGPFFAMTSILLYYLAFSFAGRGILEIQEAGWVSTTQIAFPTIHFLGIYPSIEGLILQGLLLIAAMGGGIYTFFLTGKNK